MPKSPKSEILQSQIHSNTRVKSCILILSCVTNKKITYGVKMTSKRRRVDKAVESSLGTAQKGENDELKNENVELKKEIDLLNGDITLLIDELHKCCATLRRQDLVICSQLELIRRLSKFGRRDPPANLMERSVG